MQIIAPESASVKKLNVCPGDHVLKNQLLFILDDQEEKKAILEARKMVREAKAELSKHFIQSVRLPNYEETLRAARE